MSSDLTSLETELRRLRPAKPGATLLDRLEACAADVWQRETAAELRLEQSLAASAPAPLPAGLMASLEATVSRVPFPADRTIVLFPNRAAETPRRKRAWLPAAAVVALSGALAALLVPVPDKPAPVAATPKAPAAAKAGASATHLVPANFRRGLSEATDEGVVWRSADQAHRVLRVVYKDSVTVRDASGRIYQMEEPRVEYIFLPAKID